MLRLRASKFQIKVDIVENDYVSFNSKSDFTQGFLDLQHLYIISKLKYVIIDVYLLRFLNDMKH
jgi:hypothetical protein